MDKRFFDVFVAQFFRPAASDVRAGGTRDRTTIAWLVAGAALWTLGCTVPAPGEAAPAGAEVAEPCEVRFQDRPGSVITYSKAHDSGEYSTRVDVCQGQEFHKQAYDPKAIPLQMDEYTWERDGGWKLVEGSSRIEVADCASFTKDVNVWAATLIEVLLCAESVSPEDEIAIFQKAVHPSSAGCESCYAPDQTVFDGTKLFRVVYCQTPDWQSSRQVHMDSYSFSAFLGHERTYTCRQISGVTNESDLNLLCNSERPKLPTCTN